jgi:methylated-DNA-[protein]-cysteine S-methyltransferase
MSERFFLDRVQTPIGCALLLTDAEDRLRAFDWDDHDERFQRWLRVHYGKNVSLQPGRSDAVRDAVDAYFAGDLTSIDAIPCRTAGTPFQQSVWAALREIPAGHTTSYGALAAKLGSPAATRAVGLANGSNPIGVVVPCHRVIGANGSLTGYGGGLERKRWLLAHEGVLLAVG